MGLFTWLRRRFRKRPPPSGPLHMFVQMQGKGFGYGGVVADFDEARERMEVAMAEECMRTGEMGFANYWTTHESELSEAEREFVRLAAEKKGEPT